MKKDPVLKLLVVASAAMFVCTVAMMYLERTDYGPAQFVPAAVEMVLAQSADPGSTPGGNGDEIASGAAQDTQQTDIGDDEGGGDSMAQSPLVNINTADLDELTTLPGIGPIIAQHIIDYRERVGGFSSVDQLIYVERIGQRTLENLRPLVTVDP